MKKTYFIACLTLLVASSCHNHSHQAGPLTTEDRILNDSINSIVCRGSIDLYITQDSSYDVRVIGGSNAIQKLETSLINNKLSIYQRGNFFGQDQTQVYVSINYLHSLIMEGSGNVFGSNIKSQSAFIELEGSGDINLDFIQLDQMHISLEGSGDINIVGSTSDNHISLEGSGDIDCRYLSAMDVFVDLEGSGNIKVHADSSLTVDLEGSGNVIYWGNPSNISSNISGSGNIIPN